MDGHIAERQPNGNFAPEKAPPPPVPPPDAKRYFEGNTDDDRRGNVILNNYGYMVLRGIWKSDTEYIDYQLPQHAKPIQLQSQFWTDGTETRRALVFDPEIADVQTVDISGEEGEKRMLEWLDKGYDQVGQVHEQPEGKMMFAFAKTKRELPEGQVRAGQNPEPSTDQPTVVANSDPTPQEQAAIVRNEDEKRIPSLQNELRRIASQENPS